MNKFLKLAQTFCLEHEYDPRLGYTLCCILVRGGSVVSVGYNDINKNSYVDYLCKFDTEKRKPFINLHAETSAILKARKKIDLRGCKAYIVRERPSKGLGMAKPCELCQISLKSYGITRAFYSIDTDTYGIMNLSNEVTNNDRFIRKEMLSMSQF